jgi:dihydroorotase
MRVVEGRVFYRGSLQELCLGIEDGRIAAVRKTLPGEDRVAYGDDLILPGGVDTHVHFRDPGHPAKEDFASGTLSAAVGGVTTVFDMPNTEPPATTAAALEAKRRAVAPKANVDFGLLAGIAGTRAPALPEGLAAGWKVYTAETTGRLAPAWRQVPALLRGLQGSALPVAVHAEDPTAFGPPGKDLATHDLARPPGAEASAVNVVAETLPAAHITHVTSLHALEAARVAALSTDVTAHHLLFDIDARPGARLKVNPPLRPPEHRARLWQAFASGDIPMLASDHAPHAEEEKAGKFLEAPSGTPGVATTYPAMLRLVKAGTLGLARLVDAFCTRPASRFRLRKGAIEVGLDADLAVFDPKQVVRITAKRTRYKCGWTAFEGVEAVFPHAVYVRGVRVLRDGGVEEEGQGRHVLPPAPPA